MNETFESRALAGEQDAREDTRRQAGEDALQLLHELRAEAAIPRPLVSRVVRALDDAKAGGWTARRRA
jgi:hypothetical protein